MSDLPSQYAEEIETFRHILKLNDPRDTFEKFEKDLLTSHLTKGKYIKPPFSTAKWYKVGQPCFEDKMQELKDFVKICISPKPSGTPMGKVPLQVLKELEHQARQNRCT